MINTSQKLRFRLALSLACAIVLVLPAMPARAAAETFTLHFSNVTETVPIVNPCFGPAVGVLTYDAVFHVTAAPDGYLAVLNLQGDALTVPADPNEPAFFGHFAEHQLLKLNPMNEVSTFVVTQVGPRMKFHITYHLVIDSNGGNLTVFNVACER